MPRFTVVALAMLLALDFRSCAASDAGTQSVAGTRFVKTYWSRSSTSLLDDKTVQSPAMCAHLCSQYSGPESNKCSGFHMDPDNPTCRLLAGLINGVAWMAVQNRTRDLIYRKGNECPLSKGYAVFSVDESKFCLKIDWQKSVSYSTARTVCNKDGGNVVDLENQQKYDAIKQLFTATLKGKAPKRIWVGITRSGNKFISDVTGLTPGKLKWAWANRII